jgi:hypothetical protein
MSLVSTCRSLSSCQDIAMIVFEANVGTDVGLKASIDFHVYMHPVSTSYSEIAQSI